MRRSTGAFIHGARGLLTDAIVEEHKPGQLAEPERAERSIAACFEDVGPALSRIG